MTSLVSIARSMSWPELERTSAGLAGGYRGLGLEPGDRIASLMPNRIDLLVWNIDGDAPRHRRGRPPWTLPEDVAALFECAGAQGYITESLGCASTSSSPDGRSEVGAVARRRSGAGGHHRCRISR